MGREDWYRNVVWDPATETKFREKLSRSRSGRPQYLEIQAGCLVDRYPDAALSLIDEYFETGDDFVVPAAFGIQAKAYVALGKIDEAVTAYKRALEWEASHPGLITTARLDLPTLIARYRLVAEYDYALELLTTQFRESDHAFPHTRYYWNGANALIANDRGLMVEAQEFAERALRAAAATESPFQRHRTIGLVKDASDEFCRRLKRIARASKLRSILRLMTPS